MCPSTVFFIFLLHITLSVEPPTELTDDELDLWLLGFTQQRVCFGDLGCFDLSDPWLSWSRPVPLLPQPPDVIDTQFYLLTRRNPWFPERLRTRPIVDLSGSKLKKNEKIFFIVHGFIGHHTDDWVEGIARGLLKLFNANVILVDWANGSNMINYIQAVANARLVGMEMARLIKALTDQELSSPANMHGIGYSLGAQVLAYAANASNGVYRITAIDPAQPGFEGLHPLVRLDAEDAQFVDVLHSNGAMFGFKTSAGHADFYINGGEIQPECSKKMERSATDKRDVYLRLKHYLENYSNLNDRVDSLHQFQEIIQQGSPGQSFPEPAGTSASFSLLDFLSGAFVNLFHYLACSHEKAPEYFIESLQFANCSFWGVPWSPNTTPPQTANCSHTVCSEMGMHSILYPAIGNFYVTTRKKPPYCIGMNQLEATMKNGLIDDFMRKMSVKDWRTKKPEAND